MSAQHFAVGEVAIYWRPESPHHGREVTIGSALGEYYIRDTVTGASFFTADYALKELSANGNRWVARPIYLRKKRPPSDDRQVTRWADCPWQPEKLRV